MGFDDETTSGPVDPRPERVHDDNYVLNELKRVFLLTSDAFDNQISRQTRNNADLAAHYRYTPERHRFYKNGSRVLLQYEDIGSNADFDDQRAGDEDVFVLSPSGGDTLLFKTAERFRYTVNFVSEVTRAWALNQSLTNTDDRVTIGLDTSPDGDLADGYYLEHTASHAEDEVDVYEKRSGSIIGSRTAVTLERAVDVFQRYALDYNWYNVGEESWVETYTDADAGQRNVALATTSVQAGDANAGTGGRGPISGNGHIVAEVEADSATSGLELVVGSSSFTTLGGVSASVKAKGAETPTLSVSQTTDWEPLGIAMRVDPNRPNVSVQFREIEITAGSGKVMVIACDSSNVLDSGGNELTDSDFTTTDRPDGRPEEHSHPNSALQVTGTGVVAEIPGADGTTGTTQANAGGYQLAFDTTRSVGQGSKSTTRSGDLEEKHGILDGDLAVPVAKPATTDSVRLYYTTEFDE
jgi:hypothetical protein